MSHLEEMWNCELECFQTVERLAQCLDQRGQTWKRLAQLREQVSTVGSSSISLRGLCSSGWLPLSMQVADVSLSCVCTCAALASCDGSRLG
jgi:hypothetical protein